MSGGCKVSLRQELRSGGKGRREDGQVTGIRVNTLGVVPMGSNPSNLSSIRLIQGSIPCLRNES